MVLGSRLGSTLQMVWFLLLGAACGSAAPHPRLDADGATVSGGSLGTGGATATGGSVGTGGVLVAGGSSGATTTPGTGGIPFDAPLADASQPRDASYPLVDGPNGLAVLDPQYVWDHFNELIAGTWLIGWYGGQDHFSWLRITMPTGSRLDGGLAVLAEPSIPAGVPYWSCNGNAAWMLTERPQTLDLRLDTVGCSREILIFDWFRPVSTRGKAFLEASLSAMRIADGGYGPSNRLTGLKFPDDVCDAAFTSCRADF
jgi:hypothetical protein